MSATPQPAIDQQQDSPAQAVLERFLADSLEESAPGLDKPADRQAEIDLRTDILYVLTDKIAYRKALPLSRLIREVQALQIKELARAELAEERIKASLQVLFQQRLVREFPARENHYELAHDFLVRSVVRTYQKLYRRRIEQLAVLRQQQKATQAELAVLRQQQEATDAELAVLKQQQEATRPEYARLSRMGRTVSWLLRLLPILSFGLTIGLFIYSLNETLPDFLGFAYLWVLALPGAALLLLGVAARRAAAISLAALVLLCCGASWLIEYSEPKIDAGEALHLLNSQPDMCSQFAISAAASLLSDSYTDTFSRLCHQLVPWRDVNTKNMLWNAAGLQQEHHLSSNANFCSDVSKVFGQPAGREHSLLLACQREHTPDWSFYLASVDTLYFHSSYLETGVLVHRYQFERIDPTGRIYPSLGRVGSWIGWFAFFLLIGHVLFYPVVLLGMVQNVTVSSALRRISSEISDVILIVTMLFGLGYLIASYLDWGGLTLIISLLLSHGIIYIGASAIFSALKRSSIGTLFLKLNITDRDGSSAVPVARLVGRSFLLWIWGVLNIFFGVLTLLVTPLYVWLRKDHQLLYDNILKLRTEPRHFLEDSDPTGVARAATKIADTTSIAVGKT